MILYRTIWELWSGLMWILAVLASGLCVRQCIHMFLLITADTSSGGTSVFSKSSMSMFLPKLDTLGNSRPSRRGPQSESSKLRLALRYMYGVCYLSWPAPSPAPFVDRYAAARWAMYSSAQTGQPGTTGCPSQVSTRPVYVPCLGSLVHANVESANVTLLAAPVVECAAVVWRFILTLADESGRRRSGSGDLT